MKSTTYQSVIFRHVLDLKIIYVHITLLWKQQKNVALKITDLEKNGLRITTKIKTLYYVISTYVPTNR